MDVARWYLRERGRVTGPFDIERLQLFKKRGQLTRYSEVSSDRRAWQSITTIEALFPAQAVTSPISSKQGSTDSGPNEESYALSDRPVGTDRGDPREALSWHYERAGTSLGPIRYGQLRELAARGEVGPDTLVWNETLPAWLAARDATDFDFRVLDRKGGQTQGRTEIPELGLVIDPKLHTSSKQPSVTSHAHGVRLCPLALSGFILGIVVIFSLGLIPAIGLLQNPRHVAIVGWILFWFWTCISFTASAVSILAIYQIVRARGDLAGTGLAIVGLVLGVAGFIPAAVFVALSVFSASRSLYPWQE